MKINMLPRIEIEVGGTGGWIDVHGVAAGELHFKINGHLFSFRGTHGERYAMERDLEDARKCIEAERAKTKATVE